MARDLDLLQGAWALASLEVDGAPAPAGSARIVIDGERFTAIGMGAEYGGRIELHPSREPKAITMLFDVGPEAGAANHGIYEIAADGWRLCLATRGGPAPVEFKTIRGSGHALETLTRAPAAVPAVAPLGGEPVEELQGEWAMVSCKKAGMAIPAGFAKSGRRTISGIDFVLNFGTLQHMKGFLTRDGGPGLLRLQVTEGEGQGNVQFGIFELKGDKLRTCMAGAGRPRPAGYASSAEGGETFAVWKRSG